MSVIGVVLRIGAGLKLEAAFCRCFSICGKAVRSACILCGLFEGRFCFLQHWTGMLQESAWSRSFALYPFRQAEKQYYGAPVRCV